MLFKEWLISELKETDDFIRRGLISGSSIPFYVDNNGNLVSGYQEFGLTAFQLSPQYRSINITQGDPNSQLFHKVINHLKGYIPDIEHWTVSVTNLSHHKTPDRRYGYRDRFVSHYSPKLGSIPKYMYHGTSTEMWYDGIQKNGLQPRIKGNSGSFGSYGSTISLPDRVYLSIDPDAAARGASLQAAEKHGGYPLILKIDTSGLFPEKFTMDEDDSRHYELYKTKRAGLRTTPEHKHSLNQMGTAAYVGSIPASLIQPVSYAKLKHNGKHNYHEWVPWKDVDRKNHPYIDKLAEKENVGFDKGTPQHLILLDAGITDAEGNLKIPKSELPNNDKVRKMFKDSTWALDASKIAKDANDYGMNGIRSLSYLKLTDVPDEYKKFVDALLNSKVYYADSEYLTLGYRVGYEHAIKLAKNLKDIDSNYDELLEVIKRLRKLTD